MSARMGITIGLTIAAVAFGGWRIILPGAGGGSNEIDQSVSSMLSTVVKAQFTGAEASLDAQRMATGSYAGAAVQAPIVLVRADVSSYCLQLEQGAELQHLAGPSGTPQPGAC
jgi:hypothetical protein